MNDYYNQVIEVRRKQAPTPNQKEILYAFVKENPRIQNGDFGPDFTILDSQILWQEISIVLNNVTGGARKNWRQWKKTWQDLKKNAKKKILKRAIQSTGLSLDDMEEEPPALSETLIVPAPTDNEIQDYLVSNSSRNNQLEMQLLEEVKDGTVFQVVNDDCEIKNDFNTADSPKQKVLKRIPNVRNLASSPTGIKSIFYKEKIGYMRHRKQYELKKLKCMETNNKLLFELLTSLKSIQKKMDKNSSN